ncbi:unnamed protein product [Brassica napus]|uniref:(rape) hypothetical protein n=2 Tax=Brassica napus TaxID=3708 RepID=A0A817AMM7_BRANA|nr:unnamed protein product [Brassica napus]
MDTTHSCRRGYILLLVLSYSSVFGLASNMSISNDTSGNKTDSFFESQSTSTEWGTDMGDKYIMCTESNMEIPWMISCKKSKEVFTRINFADYGNPSGKCEHYRHGNCGAKTTMEVAKKNCLGKHQCVFKVSDEMFGKSKNRKREVKTDELVHTLKKLSQTKRPGNRSGDKEARRERQKEKGAKIVEEAKKQQVTLLVVGQEKKPPVWRLLKRWAWKRRRGHAGVLKYCLENAFCMTIAVKPKKRKHGGHIITTKRHKNFWLLA